jgi:pilus assembly protein CpaC
MQPKRKHILLNRPQEKVKGLGPVAVKIFLILLTLVTYNLAIAQSPAATPAASTTSTQAPNKDIEVAMGIDVIEKLDFDFSPKVTIGNEQLLRIISVPSKKELVFKGLKPGRTNVTVRDTVGDVRLQYTVVITATGKSNIVSELRELIGDVEGLEIGIRGGKVFVGGEIVVPDDIGRVSQVLASYPDVLTLIELSPQTQRVIARKMTDELAKNNLKDVTVRVVNKVYWLEGVVSNKDKKGLAVTIAKAYLPPKIVNLSANSNRYATPQTDDIIDFIAVNEKKEPQPSPKMIKITAQFVELSKSYNKVFAFKWAPLMGADSSQITFGQTANGNLTGRQSEGTLSATITNLFPKLNAAKSAGYARTIQSGMVIVRDGFEQGGKISKQTEIPYALGTGDFTKAANAKIGLNMDVKPKILEQEKLELGITLSVSVAVPSGSAAPVTTTNDINTNVVLKSKESAAIGGIVQNTSTTDYDNTGNDPAPTTATAGQGAPATPLFRLYRSKSYSTNKSQYVIFVTPEIIESASAGTEEIRKKFRRRE